MGVVDLTGSTPVEDAAEHVWPDDLPDECPPHDAHEANMTVFRFVKHDPPTADDFARPIDNANRRGSEGEDPCELCALSVLANAADIPAFRNFVPGFKKRSVAEGYITSSHGVVKNTPLEAPVLDSHHDWWVPVGVDPTPDFQVVPL